MARRTRRPAATNRRRTRVRNRGAAKALDQALKSLDAVADEHDFDEVVKLLHTRHELMPTRLGSLDPDDVIG